ncbi:hypothetical protein ACWD4B_03110 [Streptomyces sp. NPDC002536]
MDHSSEPGLPDDGRKFRLSRRRTAAARSADPAADAILPPLDGDGPHSREAAEPHDGTLVRMHSGEPSPVRTDLSPGRSRNTAAHDQQLLAAPALNDPAVPGPAQAGKHPTPPATALAREQTTGAPATGHAVPLQVYGPAHPAPEHLPLAERPGHRRADLSHTPAGGRQDGHAYPSADNELGSASGDLTPARQDPAPAAQVHPDRPADAPSLTHGETATTEEPDTHRGRPGLPDVRVLHERDHTDARQGRTTSAPDEPSTTGTDRHPAAPIARKPEDTDAGQRPTAPGHHEHNADRADRRPTAPTPHEQCAEETGRLPAAAPASHGPDRDDADTDTDATGRPARPVPPTRTDRSTAALQQTTDRTADTAHPHAQRPVTSRQSGSTTPAGAAAPMSLPTRKAAEHRPLGTARREAHNSRPPAQRPANGDPEEFHAPAPLREPGAVHSPALPSPQPLPASPAPSSADAGPAHATTFHTEADPGTPRHNKPVAAEPSPSPAAQPRTPHDTTHHDATHPAEPHVTPHALTADNAAPPHRASRRRTARLSVPEAPPPSHRTLAPLLFPLRATADDRPRPEPTAFSRPADPLQADCGHPVFRRIAAHAPESGGQNTGIPAAVLGGGAAESAVPATDWGIPQAVLRKEWQDITRNGGTGRAP